MDELIARTPVRRRRVRQQLSLVERLQQRAEAARELATRTTCNVEREMLLQRADQADTAAEFAAELMPVQPRSVFRTAASPK